MTPGSGTDSKPENGGELHFHYSREERLKKLKRNLPERRRFFSKRGRRGIFILLFDILLVAVVLYLLNRPVNVYLEKNLEGLIYELNITGIKGQKVLFGFTMKNGKTDILRFEKSVPVIVQIMKGNEVVMQLKKEVAENTTLSAGESSSVVFLIEESSLPKSANVQLYYNKSLLFEKNIRF